MLVPKFTITQTDNEVILKIRVPYIRVGDAEAIVVSQSAQRCLIHRYFLIT